MTPMPAPVFSMPPNAHQETIDFLRRLSSMLTGGRNAEMLLQAASMIETLSHRAATAEQLFAEQQKITRAISSCARWPSLPPTI
jgi:hypothetical protein